MIFIRIYSQDCLGQCSVQQKQLRKLNACEQETGYKCYDTRMLILSITAPHDFQSTMFSCNKHDENRALSVFFTPVYGLAHNRHQ